MQIYVYIMLIFQFDYNNIVLSRLVRRPTNIGVSNFTRLYNNIEVRQYKILKKQCSLTECVK